jgi:hypothetical protein
MKKADIKPGVLYAIWNRNSDYDTPTPVVFLNAPAAGELYMEPRYPGTEVRTCFRRAVDGIKPQRGSWGGSTYGYPAVQPGTSRERVAAGDLLHFTLTDFKAATSAYGDGYQFTLITSLGKIAGPWDEVKAEYDARQQARNEHSSRETVERQRSHARADAAIAALNRAGIRATRDTMLSTVQHVRLSLDEAEKLAELLRDVPVPS